MLRADIAKLALFLALGVALLVNWLLAAVYFFAWAHYDGTDDATLITIAGLGATVFIVPLLACIFPGKLKVSQRFLVCIVTFALGYLFMAALG